MRGIFDGEIYEDLYMNEESSLYRARKELMDYCCAHFADNVVDDLGIANVMYRKDGKLVLLDPVC